jgi:signal transduction histidine kinase
MGGAKKKTGRSDRTSAPSTPAEAEASSGSPLHRSNRRRLPVSNVVPAQRSAATGNQARETAKGVPANLKASAESWKNHLGVINRRASLLAEAEELAGMGSWEFDLVKRQRIWSEGLIRIMEVDWDREIQGVDPFWSRIHPDDREAMRAGTDRAIADRAPFTFEFRAKLPSGRHAVFSVRGRAVYNHAGRPTRLMGVTWDVTAQKEREERLRKRETLLAQAERVANFGTWHQDLISGTMTGSEDLLKIYGLQSKEEWDQKLHWTRVDPDDHACALETAARARRECGEYDTTLRYHHPDGGLRTLHLRCVSLPGPDGKPATAIGVTQDVTAYTERDEGLRKSRTLLSHAEEIAHFGSWECDFATGRMSLSKNLLKMRALESESENEGDPEAYWERVHPEDRGARAEMKRAWEELRPFTHVVRYRRHGELRVFHTRGLTVRDAAGVPVRAIGVVQDVTDQVRAEEQLRRLSRQLIQTRDTERRRLARELHESAGQSLAALKMTLGCIRDQLPPDDAVRHLLLQSSSELADEAIREIRTISYLIHPPMLDEAGLGPALRLYLKGFSQRSGIVVTLAGDEAFGRIAQEAETTLFRIVQEALTNVHRHSGSGTAQVRLAREGGSLIVEVADQGQGLPQGARAARSGVGIAGMLERVKHLNGAMEFDSTPGKGTRVRAILPDNGDPPVSGAETSPEIELSPGTRHTNSLSRKTKDGQKTKGGRRRVAAQ